MECFLLHAARCSGSFHEWLLRRTLFPVGLLTPAGASYAPLLGGGGRDRAACGRGEQDHRSRGQRTAQLREGAGGMNTVVVISYISSSLSTYY